MRNIYIISRIVENDIGLSMPNLGVHSNVEKANNHLNGIRENRLNRNYKLIFNRTNKEDKFVRTVRVEFENITETIYIEKWGI